MRRVAVLGAVALLSWLALAMALAQSIDRSGLPQLGLSPQQKQTIYLSLANQPHKQTAAPEYFLPAPGAQVPVAVKLAPMPDTIAEVIPQTRGYEVAFIANQVVIVEPVSKRVIEIISGGG